MNDLLPFVVIGLAAGSIYGLAGVGLVLTYRTSGVFNFAYGAIAATCAFSFYWLWIWRGLDWQVAALIAVFVVGTGLGLVLELLTRALARVSTELQIVGMVGLTLGISGSLTIWRTHWGTPSANAAHGLSFLPTSTFQVDGVFIGRDQAITMVVALVATLLLSVMFRVSRSGLAMRAVVDDPALVSVLGTNPVAVRRSAWIIGTVFASMSGVLLTQTIGLNSMLLVLLVVQAFGAAAVGYFANLPLTYLGGLAIGIGASVSTRYIGTIPWLGGFPTSLPFVVLFVALLVTPARLLRRRSASPPPPPRDSRPARLPVMTGIGVVVVASLSVVPSLVGPNLAVWTVGVMTIVLFLSLGLLIRDSGQVSLCQLAFAAVGAAAFCHFASDFGVPWLLAVLLAGLVTVPVGLLVAVPAIRLSGVFLALATLGFGILVEKMFYLRAVMFGGTASGLAGTRPSFASTDRGYYYVVLAMAVLASILVVMVTRGRLGRLLNALRDSPRALVTGGTTTNLTRLLVFGISSFLAGVYGALYAGFAGRVNAATFPSFNSLTIIAVVVLAIGGVPWYAIVATAMFSVIPSYIHVDAVQAYVQIIFGYAALLVGIRSQRATAAAQAVRGAAARLAGRVRPQAALQPATSIVPAVGASPHARDGLALELRDLVVTYGGLVALDGVTLSAPTGSVTGLIGPNGAGKTTLFDAACGLVRPRSGTVQLGAVDLTRRSAAGRARAGLGRTFQRPELYGSLTVGENVALGRESRLSGAGITTQLASSPRQRDDIRSAADRALELTGLRELRDERASTLTTAQRRLVELARVLAGAYDVILLDEPSSGLDQHETAEFGEIMRTVVDQLGIGLVVVEHDMSLALGVSDQVYVLDFGEMIFDGTPLDVQRDPRVQAAYLGIEVAAPA